jgi:hypothetical protein
VAQALGASKDNWTRLRGIRTQALFAQLVLALDACELMLTVDAGDIYADGPISSGDFLLVLRDGRRLLVEVKTVSRSGNASGDIDLEKSQRRTIRAKDVEGLRRAANLLGAEPYLAVYFEFMHVWALVRVKDLSHHGTNYRLQFSHDIMHNNMAVLGDRTFAVEAPIEVRLYPHAGAHPSLTAADIDRSIPFEVATRVVYVGGARVSEPSDADFALFLGLYGHWTPELAPHVENGKLKYVSLRSEPEEPVEGQGFQIVGPVSHMYSKYFLVRTSNEQGSPVALDIQATPSLIAKFLARPPSARQFKTLELDVRASDADMET